MKILRIFCLFSVLLFTASCSNDEYYSIGTISFYSDVDFEFWLFNNRGNQVAHDSYENGNRPIVVNMKSTGIFVLQATSADDTKMTQTLTYLGGNIHCKVDF